ncbi:Centromere-associated protein E [Eumeta japonica]|uniref:Kinesin-like protein n=1 Tax=Eumeta variegata TaxID=151549 RepID=A0A4C1SQE9_EUMVA|nr:Centromere-associated protein E [Eumeta japonica]
MDDKVRMPLGITAANAQTPILMHLDYHINLQDHDFVVAEKHKLIPFVYAGIVIKKDSEVSRHTCLRDHVASVVYILHHTRPLINTSNHIRVNKKFCPSRRFVLKELLLDVPMKFFVWAMTVMLYAARARSPVFAKSRFVLLCERVEGRNMERYRVSYIEIYNDKIIDLLSVENENIKVHETVEGVKINATEKVITNPEELLDYMKEGDANRQIGTTNMNEKSSRSHSIFQITIESREHAEDEAEAEIGCVNVSQLNLVDLAGSERAAQTGATGSRFKEGTFINKSLSVLGLVIKQLSEDNKFINYRDCKLTRILQNSLGGNAKTSIICAVTPAAMEETLSTLQFANRAKAIKNKPEVNAVSTNATMIQKLTKQLAKLQYELESKRYLEQDNILLTMKIDSLQRQILNSFNQKSQSDILAKNRRKTWCAPRRATVSTLHPIQEDQQDISNVQGFSTPVVSHSTHKQFLVPTDAFKCLNRSSQVDRFSSMSNISEESMPSSKKHDTRVSETIEIGTSKTPPCILRDKAKKAEKMYQDIIDFTEREKVYPPAVVEYMKRLDQHQSVISNLEDRVSTLSEECREKHNVIKLLEEKVIESDTQIRSITSNKKKLEEMCQEFNTKLIDLEVSYETLQKKAKSREKELLILLEEQKTKLSKCTVTLDSDSDAVLTFVFNPSPILSFGSGLAFDSDPGSVLDSALHPVFNSDSVTNHSFDFGGAGDYYKNKI